MGLIWLLIVGAAAGFLATRAMGMELPVPHTVALGVIGALFGGIVVRLLLGLFGGFLGAFIGVILLIWGYKTFIEGR
ncbi:GlsB/YeaQ/YmgE family stress response membrane protein [Halovulum sp. GXIMD14793]